MQTTQTINEQPAPKKQVGLPVILAAVLVIPATAYLVFFYRADDVAEDSKGIEPTALFDEAVACSQPGAALNRAQESEDAAMAKMERYPFESQDGVTAVRLGTEAAQCYQIAGNQSDAQRVRRRADVWKQRINQDYHSARLQLRVAQQNGQIQDALIRVRALRALLAHRNDAYTAWLERLERAMVR